jgi:hypothetical protein
MTTNEPTNATPAAPQAETSPRPRIRATIAIAGTVAAAGAATAISATPVLALIPHVAGNHNETLVRSPG